MTRSVYLHQTLQDLFKAPKNSCPHIHTEQREIVDSNGIEVYDYCLDCKQSIPSL